MHPTVWTLNDNNQPITLQAQKLTLFQQCKIIECTASNDLNYLLFFYKDQFLTVQPLVKFDGASFLGQVKQFGSHIQTPNPLFSKLLSPTTTISVTPITQLLRKIKINFTIEESVLIFSYFDSYLTVLELENLLKDCFFTHRRDGKILGAYRLAEILFSRGYKQNWLLSTSQHPDYSSASKHFQAPLSSLLASDPIYVEQTCFLDLENHYDLLLHLYKQQNRHLDLMIISITNWLKQPKALNYPNLIQTLSTYLNEDELLQCLQSLLPTVSPKSSLHQDVYQRLITKQDFKAAVDLLLAYSIQLSEKETLKLPDLFEKVSLSTLNLPIDVTSKRLFRLFKHHPIHLEKILLTELPLLLKEQSLTQLQTWLQEIPYSQELPIVQKINEMVKLKENPDCQLELGTHYFDLQQYEQAIECFCWDMELNPNRTEPVQWLAKTYFKLGKHEEGESYQQLLKHK